MENKRLSLCIIARNEAEIISNCITSVGILADEIIVVDTGSTDSTPDIARSLGAKVITAKWEDDFSKARNLSLEHAQGKWILFLDCDEELCPDSLPELERLLDVQEAEAFFIQIVNKTAEGAELTVPSIRLFRNRKEYRFTGRIHEQIAGNIIQHSDKSKILSSNVSVLHLGYHRQIANIPAKIKRNMRILENISEEKRDGFYFYNLGTEYLRLNQKEEALAQFLKAAPLTHPGHSYGPIMIKRTITLLLELGRYKQALQGLEYYRGIYQDYTDLVLLTGLCHFMCGRYSQAQEIIKNYFSMPPAPSWYPLERSFISQSPENLLKIAAQHAVDKNYPPLSVCIIGKNESNTLAACIKSVNEIAAQVIYVDTGSNDRSQEIAFQLGAEVYNLPWQYDFSASRNYALDQVRGDWVLVLDADEILPETSVMSVIQAIKSKSGAAYLVKINTPLDAKIATQNNQLTGSIRLFRRGPRYSGNFAEEIIFPGLDLKPEPAPDVEIMHLHFHAPRQQIMEKLKTWEEIALRISDKSPVKYFVLGRGAFYAQDYHQAAEYFKYSLELDLKNENSALAFYYYILSLINIREYEEAIKIAQHAIKACPDYTDLYYLEAIAHSLIGEVQEAGNLLRKCLQMGDSNWQKYLCNPGTGSFKALLSLSTVYVQQQKIQEAINLLIQAAKIPASAEQAIGHLTALQEVSNISTETVLENHGLLNGRNIMIIAQALAKMGKQPESWKYLTFLHRQVIEEQEWLNRMVGIIETHIFHLKGQVLRINPEHPILNCT